MMNAVNWIKTHKLLTFNFLVVAFILFTLFRPLMMLRSIGSFGSTAGAPSYEYGSQYPTKSVSFMDTNAVVDYGEVAPQPDVVDRKVVVNSNFSLLVKNVVSTLDQIKSKTLELSGYVVSSNLNKQEFGENATLVVRVPSDKVETIIKYLRGVAVKVVSENVSGNDITDQYMDIERRISDLEKQRSKMELIMESASTVDQMLTVQRGLFQIQDQIDAYKGKMLYMDGTTKTSKLTIYISTDELSLPYTPDKTWRPEVIFKQAVRSMLGFLQGIGGFIIWVVVYIPILVIAIVAFKMIRKLFQKRIK